MIEIAFIVKDVVSSCAQLKTEDNLSVEAPQRRAANVPFCKTYIHFSSIVYGTKVNEPPQRDSWTGRIHLTRISHLKWTGRFYFSDSPVSLSHTHKTELERFHFVPPPLYQSVSIQQFDLLFKTGLSPPLVFIHSLSPFSFLLLPLSPFPGATHMTRVIAIIC